VRISIAIIVFIFAISLRATDYTTYIGDANPYQVAAMTTDANGVTYITGSRVIVGPPPDGTRAITDVFVGKLDPSGNFSLLATLSGKGSDQASGIALDTSGNIFVVGSTTSTDFPLHHPLQSIGGLGSTGFLVKLNADGTVLYSTYFGGTKGSSNLRGVAVDLKGDVYVTGETLAPDYPHTQGLPAGTVHAGLSAISGGFFAKIASTGDRILYAGALTSTNHACVAGSSCFLSEISTSGTSIAVDPMGNAYIAGNTFGLGLPTTPGALRTSGIGAFVAKVKPDGSGLVYLTLLGSANFAGPSSSPGNLVYAIATDAAGDAYVAGSTWDMAFPVTTSAFQTTLSVPTPQPVPPPLTFPSDAFVAKINPSGNAMIWATFLGGTGSDRAQTLATDAAGNVWVSGITNSTDFPSSSQWPNSSEFLAELSSSGSALVYSALFPGSSFSAALAVDASGAVHTAGGTGVVSSFAAGAAPGQTPAQRFFGISNAAGGVLAGRVAAGELIAIYGLHLGPPTAQSSAFNAAGFLPTTLGGVQVRINGTAAPLLYVSDTQINAVVPVGAMSGPATLQISQGDASLPDFPLMVDLAAPQVFRYPDGSAIAMNEDGTLNSPTNRAKPGSYISIWATGAGPFLGADGQMAVSTQSYCECEIIDVSRRSRVSISYEGAAPGFVNGTVQIKFQATPPIPGAVFFSGYLSVAAKYSDLFSVFLAN
jgi:uncharacterized protein (TIGR03437 family)